MNNTPDVIQQQLEQLILKVNNDGALNCLTVVMILKFVSQGEVGRGYRGNSAASFLIGNYIARLERTLLKVFGLFRREPDAQNLK